MANIDALFNLYTTTGITKLLACYQGDIVNVDNNQGYQQNITSGLQHRADTYLDKLYFINETDTPRSFDGETWLTSGVRNHFPNARYIHQLGEKLYIAYPTINGIKYPTMVMKSDLPYNNDCRWGLEWGTNLRQQAGESEVFSDNAAFKDHGIKVGDSFFITTGTNAGQYYVKEIISNTQLALTTNLTNTATDSSYWTGRNWFYAKGTSNDFIRGLGDNSDRLLIFMLNSLHWYNEYNLDSIKGAPGTSTDKSIVNIGPYTLWFHGSAGDYTGFYVLTGTTHKKISDKIQRYIDGISYLNYDQIVSWREGNWYRSYVGDITNSQHNISVANAIISYNVNDNTFSIDPNPKKVICSTSLLENNRVKTFVGDDSAEVFDTPSGYSYDTTPISFVMETGPIYPNGSEAVLKLSRIQVIARDARGVRVRYKLVNAPYETDTNWLPLDDLEGDKTELWIPPGHNRASGVNLRFEEISSSENALLIEKISIFYTVEGTKL